MNRAYLKSPYVINNESSRMLVAEKCECADCVAGGFPMAIGEMACCSDGLSDGAHMAVLPGFASPFGPPCFPFSADVPVYCDYSTAERGCVRPLPSNSGSEPQKSTDANGNALDYRTGEGAQKMRQLLVSNGDRNTPQTKVVPLVQNCSTNVQSLATLWPDSPKTGAKTLRSIYNEASNV